MAMDWKNLSLDSVCHDEISHVDKDIVLDVDRLCRTYLYSKRMSF